MARGMTTRLTTVDELTASDIGAVVNFCLESGAWVTGKVAALVGQDENTEVYLERGPLFKIPNGTHVTVNRPVQRNRG